MHPDVQDRWTSCAQDQLLCAESPAHLRPGRATPCSLVDTLLEHLQPLNNDAKQGVTMHVHWSAHRPCLNPACVVRQVRHCARAVPSHSRPPPLACRLPKLTDIRLVATNPPMHIPMAMLLGSMRTSLPNLRVLTLEMHHSWPDSKLVWEELGGCAHLTALSIKLDVSSPYKQVGYMVCWLAV